MIFKKNFNMDIKILRIRDNRLNYNRVSGIITSCKLHYKKKKRKEKGNCYKHQRTSYQDDTVSAYLEASPWQ